MKKIIQEIVNKLEKNTKEKDRLILSLKKAFAKKDGTSLEYVEEEWEDGDQYFQDQLDNWVDSTYNLVEGWELEIFKDYQDLNTFIDFICAIVIKLGKRSDLDYAKNVKRLHKLKKNLN